jgi:hypothetical protein
MQDTTFLELTHANTRRAAARARQLRPRVSIVSVSERVYRVSGSQGAVYTVRLSAGNGRLLAQQEGRCDETSSGSQISPNFRLTRGQVSVQHPRFSLFDRLASAHSRDGWVSGAGEGLRPGRCQRKSGK